MKTKTIKIFFGITFFCLSLSVFSCRKSGENSAKSLKTYTYNTTSTSPATWNPAEYQLNNEGLVIGLTGMGLYDFILNSSKNGHEVICEMASEFPQDVTSEYAGNELYKIPSDAKSGYAWKIELNKAATWDDKTPITAETYEYSIKQYLNPQMKNYRAANFYSDALALANGESYYNGKSGWENVGFIKNDDYSFTLILIKPVSLFFIEYSLTSPFLLKEDLFEANKKQTGDIIKTTYCTSVETSASCGPYKVSNFQAGKSMNLEKNPNWYGWTDGKHEGQFQTTGFYIQYITEHQTCLNLFLQGNLDDIGLTANDLKLYGNSAFRKTTPSSYTWKLSFNIDKEALKKENVPGYNHTILSYLDFRKGISYSLDRQNYVDTITPSSDVGYGLLNYLYVADPDSGELYRDTLQAQKALCELYNTNSIDEISAYDKELAANLMLKAYNEALANKDILPSDKIQIDFHTYSAEETNMRSVNFLQDSINAAVKGTELEGKILVQQVTDEDYYSNMKKGNVDVSMTAWGGSAFDPYGVTWCYCTKDALNEFGFDPEKETLTINLDGKNITKTYYDWHIALNSTTYSDAPLQTRNTILAAVEKGLLSYYNMIPIRYMNTTGLRSQRIVDGSEYFINSLVEFGGIRFTTYTMDDFEWANYCAKNKNKLKY